MNEHGFNRGRGGNRPRRQEHKRGAQSSHCRGGNNNSEQTGGFDHKYSQSNERSRGNNNFRNARNSNRSRSGNNVNDRGNFSGHGIGDINDFGTSNNHNPRFNDRNGFERNRNHQNRPNILDNDSVNYQNSTAPRYREKYVVNNFFQTKSLLQNMLSEEYEENISLQLLDPKIQIKNFLNNSNKHDREVIHLIMKVILKASENKLMESNFRDFISILIDTNFITKTIDLLISVEMKNNFELEIFHLLIKFLKLLFDLVPGLVYENLYSRVHNLFLLADNLRLKNDSISEDVLNEIEDLKVMAESNNPYTKPTQKNIKKFIYEDNIDPPDSYRNISIFPNTEDLEIGTKEVFLRRNKERGVYKSVDDYLDVQFRLMREDFIQPLREGLSNLKFDRGKKRMEIRVYKKVCIVNSLPSERMGIIHNINFDNTHYKRVKWMQSKRFLYGSLLCLSNDNFKTLLFATVANRDIKDLEQGFLSVKFYDCSPLKNIEYTMVETTNMFEGYRHVLLKLQETNADNLCFQKYLVYADENITFPLYLSRNNGLQYEYNNLIFYPGLVDRNWPRAVDFELDDSQFQAFKSALTKEITIIQGPPGTGKTYLGLKICHCIIENVQKKLLRFGPILIVCYTNHALDQFLEGISKFTKNIVRIGSRSKSELMQNFSLINWKKKTNSSTTGGRKRAIFMEMFDVKDNLIQLQAGLKMSHDNLISLERLRIYINDMHFEHLKNIGLKNWLNGVSIINEMSTWDLQLENIIEWIIYEEIIEKVQNVIIEVQVDILNDVEDEYNDDNDMEANFINNHRQLEMDDENINNLNVEFENAIGKLRAITFDEDILPISNNDGFTIVKSKVTNQLFKKRLRSQDKMTQEEYIQLGSLDNLDIRDRWKLYNFWKFRYVEFLDEKSKSLEIKYENLTKQLNELHFEEDRQVMMQQSIIGMTTTGAARYGRVLAQIQCKTIIVEEAAEVLESHIIGSLNPGCEHLILIGDHKQLKPNPTVYDLAKTYQLDLSLFERLVNNNLHYNTLELQHRMRPEIAQIMVYIYENLKNHDSVLTYQDVPAVSKNIFFFNHMEDEQHNDEISSYANKFEAEFIVNFCRHLMKNGIENTRITVLTLYSGQLFLLRTMMPKQTFDGIRVCVVDNYQGEENDIILLSLVRSNDKEKIGFLNIDNRICVCLSRAKIGLYVFGNFQILANQNKLWKQICQDLKRKQLLGDTLTLLCQNHPEKRLEVKLPSDFNKYPEGGCEQLCNQRLNCGHACRKACHFLDKIHKNVKCVEICTKLCPNGHRCPLKCWQKCKDCNIQILKVIPNCNHQQMMRCCKVPEPSDCLNVCNRILNCGHKCLRSCKDKCEACIQKVMKIVPECGHESEQLCSETILVCSQKCHEILDCEHPCVGTCGSCSSGRLHESCGDKCKNLLVCGHACKAKCSLNCPPCNANCNEGCVHNRCPKKCGDECISCYENCKWKCNHKKCTNKCYQMCNREVCDEACGKLLDCKTHCGKRFQCYGVCGEPCRKVCLNCDPEVKEIFFGTEDDEDAKFVTLWTCGHSFECQSMDRFMATIPDNGEIVQKRCPRCNTVINKRSCFRYLNIVKKIFDDIKNVQNKISFNDRNEEKPDFLKFVKNVEKYSPKFNGMFDNYKIKNYFSQINTDSDPLSNYQTTKYSKSLDLVYEVYNTLYLKSMNLDPILDIDYNYIRNAIIHLLKWLHPIKRRFNHFEVSQYNGEFDRIKNILNLTESRKSQPFFKDLPDLINELKQCKGFTKKYADEFFQKLNNLKKKYYLPNTEITEMERKEIVIAIGLGKGRWFKCPNGHYYVIGDCGGANQIAKCAECDEKIGGENHRILDTNRFVPEMDDAPYPAFSDLANMDNYQFI